MYAQARSQPVYRHSAKQTSAFEHVQKCTRGCSFSNEPCDCIKSLKLGDPACGSGNFLTESYIALRKLENKSISIQYDNQQMFGEVINPVKVSIGQFYGIEINDFAVSVARTALWIAESQMLRETEELIHQNIEFLPLKSYPNITEGNALRMDWENVVPKDKQRYIMGNPPFVGAKEFINGYYRYCLWLGDCSPKELRSMPECIKSIEAVKQFRLGSSSAGTRKLAEKPTRFHVENMPNSTYILVPRHSSEARRYIPFGFVLPDIFASDAVQIIPNATIYHSEYLHLMSTWHGRVLYAEGLKATTAIQRMLSTTTFPGASRHPNRKQK